MLKVPAGDMDGSIVVSRLRNPVVRELAGEDEGGDMPEGDIDGRTVDPGSLMGVIRRLSKLRSSPVALSPAEDEGEWKGLDRGSGGTAGISSSFSSSWDDRRSLRLFLALTIALFMGDVVGELYSITVAEGEVGLCPEMLRFNLAMDREVCSFILVQPLS